MTAAAATQNTVIRYIRVDEYYAPEEVRTWLYARHPQLEGERAIEVILNDDSARVLAILDRLDADVYL